MADNNILFAIVPANLTDRLQPLDISVNKSVKDHLRNQFSHWYSEKLCDKISDNSTSPCKVVPSECAVDLSLSTLKPLGVSG